LYISHSATEYHNTFITHKITRYLSSLYFVTCALYFEVIFIVFFAFYTVCYGEPNFANIVFDWE